MWWSFKFQLSVWYYAMKEDSALTFQRREKNHRSFRHQCGNIWSIRLARFHYVQKCAWCTDLYWVVGGHQNSLLQDLSMPRFQNKCIYPIRVEISTTCTFLFACGTFVSLPCTKVVLISQTMAKPWSATVFERMQAWYCRVYVPSWPIARSLNRCCSLATQ